MYIFNELNKILFQKNFKICIIGDERHLDEAKTLGLETKVLNNRVY